MRGVNKVIIIGNLGADPETRQFNNGGSVTNISVATSEQWTDKESGEKREATEWHRIALFNRLGEIAAQYLRKGSKVYIEGKLQTRKWQDQSGADRYSTEVVLQGPGTVLTMLDGASGGGGGGGRGGNDGGYDQGGGYGGGGNSGGGYDQGGGYGGGSSGGGSSSGGGGGGGRSDMDDEIPF